MKSHQIKFTAMGGPCEIYLYGENQEQCQSVSTLAHHEVLRLEKKYSRYRDDSITSLINQNAGLKKTTVDAETAVLLDFAATCHEQSEGLFDITSGVLRQAWNFKKAIIPIQKEIDRLLPLIGWSKIHWQKPDIFLPHPEMQIDFGGYVKEYAADSVASICLDNEIKHGLVNLAGDVKIIGPHPNGKGWQIGIRHPRKPAQAIASIECQAGALASSGDYECGELIGEYTLELKNEAAHGLIRDLTTS